MSKLTIKTIKFLAVYIFVHPFVNFTNAADITATSTPELNNANIKANDNTEIANDKTEIDSDRLEMFRSDDGNKFHFSGNVNIQSKDFTGNCNDMEVFTKAMSQPKSGKEDNLSNVKKIIAKGSVEILSYGEKGKTVEADSKNLKEPEDTKSSPEPEIIAHAGRAEIFPQEGKMVLTENPKVESKKEGEFKGEKITIINATKQILVEGKSKDNRAKVVLSGAGKIEKKQENADKGVKEDKKKDNGQAKAKGNL